MGKEVVCLNLRSFLAAVSLTTLMLALALAPPSGSQLQRQYDPWADINDDGLIDMRDIAYEGRLFGTTGDPTKHVVIKHDWSEGNFSFSLGPNENKRFNISAKGFETLTLYIKAWSRDVHSFQVYLGFLVNGERADEQVVTIRSYSPLVIMIIPPQPWGWGWPANFRRTYSVTFSELIVWIWNNSTSYALWGNIYYHLNT